MLKRCYRAEEKGIETLVIEKGNVEIMQKVESIIIGGGPCGLSAL